MDGYSRHVAPLTDLMRKGGFLWIPEAQECFEKFKGVDDFLSSVSITRFQQTFLTTL